MDILTDRHQISRLEIVDTGRRRRWSEGEKLRIVEESLAGSRLASATARRHGISTTLLFAWRKAYREAKLVGEDDVAGFVPAIVAPDSPRAPPVGEAQSSSCDDPTAHAISGRMVIVLSGGRRVIVDSDVNGAALRRVLDVLERR